MKTVFVASEAVPFAKTGGLADVCGALPIALTHQGVEATVVMPRYSCVDKAGIPVKRMNPAVSSAQLNNGVLVLFIEHEGFFQRDGLYGDGKSDHPDNLERFQFFCEKTLEVLKQLGVRPDIVHCHDWQTGLVPAYLKHRLNNDPFYEQTKTVFTIHNLAYQGLFPKEQFGKLGLEDKHFSANGLEFYDQISLLKSGIMFSDLITTVSPHYAQEIQGEEFGCGMDGILRGRQDDLTGILNGIDRDIWDPAKDTLIKQPYGTDDLSGKQANKSALQRMCGLPETGDVPVFGFVGRLSHQKGIDLLLAALEDMDDRAAQIVILGVGEGKYHDLLTARQQKSPGRLAVLFQFDERIAHQIYAGSDFLLMPSVFEPCGLNQMIAMCYGTLPVVSRVGGLSDTVSEDSAGGNGFVMTEYSVPGLLGAVDRALACYRDPQRMAATIGRAMAADFSWDHSAAEYVRIYNRLLEG